MREYLVKEAAIATKTLWRTRKDVDELIEHYLNLGNNLEITGDDVANKFMAINELLDTRLIRLQLVIDDLVELD